MLITFLQDVICVIPGCNVYRLTPKLLNTIQTPNTFENRNVIRYNRRRNIFTRIFQPKIGRKIRIFSLGWKVNILIKLKKFTLSQFTVGLISGLCSGNEPALTPRTERAKEIKRRMTTDYHQLSLILSLFKFFTIVDV